jgi:predicted amidophosphoribosyltransferase
MSHARPNPSDVTPSIREKARATATGVVDAVRTVVTEPVDSRSVTYCCGFCGQDFDHDQYGCPDCGGPVTSTE